MSKATVNILLSVLLGSLIWGLGTWALISMYVVYKIRCLPVYLIIFSLMVFVALNAVAMIWGV